MVDKDNNSSEEIEDDIIDNIDDEMKQELPPSEDMRERRYLWIARIFAIFSAVSLCTNLILLIAIFGVVPLNRVEPFMVTFQNKEDQIVKVEKLNVDNQTLEFITESFVREYVKLRNTVLADEDEMNRRWSTDGAVRWLSSLDVYSDFSTRERPILMGKMQVERFTREIDIKSVVKHTDGIHWDVRFSTKDMVGESHAPLEEMWKATIAVQFKQNRELSFSDRIKNPLGFTVVRYLHVRENSARRGGNG